MFRTFQSFLALLFVCTFPATMRAQSVLASATGSATIIGTVLDPNGDVVPDATVTLKNASLEDARQVVTQGTGFFKLDRVAPGTHYRVIVSAPGFAAWSSDDIAPQAGQFITLNNVMLRIATVQVTTTVMPQEEIAAQQVKAEESQRIIGFIPNFYVTYDHDAVPLTIKLKFHLAFRSLIDPVTTAGFLANSALYQAGGYPGYGQGAKGFGQRVGATFAGGYTNVLVGDAVLPSLLHQDPRYFFQGTGSTKSRLLHAIASPFITKGDDGRREFNYSNIGGDLASGAVANAYYPDKDRGANLVVKSALIGAGGRMANALVQEFFLHKLTSKGTKNESFVENRNQ